MAVPAGPLVGRRSELATLGRLVSRVRRGQGAAVLITGEAGIGKSRLASEAAALAAEAGVQVLSGRAVAGGGTYRAPAEALARLLRDPSVMAAPALEPYRAALGALLGGDDAADRAATPGPALAVDSGVVLGEAVLALLRTVFGPSGCLLVLEDLHWADANTRALVTYLADAVAREHVLLAVTSRDEGPRAWLANLAARPAVMEMRPERLSRAEIAEVAASIPLSSDALTKLAIRSDGLPLLVCELLDAGDLGSVPPTWAALVAGRLDAVAAETRAVVVAASVSAGDPDWRLLATVTGMSEEAVVRSLREGTAAGLFADAGGRLRWRHALTRDAVLATLLTPERAALAIRMADALERHGAPGDREAAAELLLDGGSTERAAALLVTLAREDSARGAVRAAAERLALAAETGRLVGEVTTERVRVLTMLGEVVTALDMGDAALDGGDVVGDAHAELCLMLARAAIVGGQWAAAQGYVDRADRPSDARSTVLAADAAFGAGDVARAAELARAVSSDPAARPETRCEALMVLGRTQIGRDLTGAAATFREAAQLAAEHALTPWRIEALFGLGSIEFTAGDASSASLTLARDLATGVGMLGRAVQADLLLAEGVLLADGPRAALPHTLDAIARADQLQMSSMQAMGELMGATQAALAGDPAAMTALLDAAGSRADAPAEVATMGPVVRALPHLMDHRVPLAASLVDEGIPALMRHGSAAPTSYFGLWTLLRTAVGDRDEAARAAQRRHHSVGAATNRAALAYADAIASGRNGDPATAATLYAKADEQLAGMPWWNRILRLLALESAVVDGWGDPVPVLREDLAAHEADGATGPARTCRDLLRAAGAPVRRGRGRRAVPPKLRRAGITSREVDVLELVAAELTNAQIAAQLFLSTRTVETHVASLLAKTGTEDRGALRTWSAAHGVASPQTR